MCIMFSAARQQFSTLSITTLTSIKQSNKYLTNSATVKVL